MGVVDEAIRKIKALVVSGEVQPGGRLPAEAELAAQLNVSRNSLREAVRALTLIQVLHVRQGDGTYVTSLEPSVLLEGTAFIMDLLGGGQDLEVWHVRRILEPAAAALAAARIDAAMLERLREELGRMDLATSIDELTEADINFHRTLVEAAGNRLLASLIDSLASQSIRARVWGFVKGEDVVEHTKQEHRAIFEGIQSHDPELASAAAAAHIARSEVWLRRLVEAGQWSTPDPADGETDGKALLP